MDFFNEIATKSKKIDASFEKNNVVPVIELQKYGLETVMMIDEPFDRIDEGTGIRTDKNIAFEIVQFRNTKSANIPNARELKEHCLLVVHHVLSYIRDQQRNGNMTDVFVDGAELTPIDYFEINWHGYRCNISFRTPLDLSYKSEDWN
jgi:hypothetical protein